MAIKVTTRRVFKAMPMTLDDGTTVIELDREIHNRVRDAAGRELYSHAQHGRQERTTLDTLTVREAAQLLQDLADTIGFIAIGEE